MADTFAPLRGSSAGMRVVAAVLVLLYAQLLGTIDVKVDLSRISLSSFASNRPRFGGAPPVS